MSKSPYLSNPNILAHPDRIVQKVELDMTAQDSYLAGSPISAEGKLANDASAIGILLYDVHKAIGGRTGVVVIFGRIKQDVAAEHSGITISAEAKAALIDITFTGDGCRMGGGGLTELPEGYPYKEGFHIVWDGSSGEIVEINGVEKVYLGEAGSDPASVIGTTLIYSEPGQSNTSSLVVPAEAAMLGKAIIVDAMSTIITFEDNAALDLFGDGSYVLNINGKKGVYISPTKYDYWEMKAETIHPMAEEFIQLTSPNGTKYKLTVSDDGTLSAVAVS